MYLTDSKDFDEMVEYGIDAAIFFASLAQDRAGSGFVGGEEILLREIQAKLYLAKEKAEKIFFQYREELKLLHAKLKELGGSIDDSEMENIKERFEAFKLQELGVDKFK